MPDDNQKPRARDISAGPRDPAAALSLFFSHGFRPFFLLTALQAVLTMALFLFWIAVHHAGGQVVDLSIAQAPHVWHAHEMLYGYTVGVIAGFMLTAVPNWTGTKAVGGPVLMVLVGVWLAGRVVMGLSADLPGILVAIIDLAFLPLLAPLVIAAMLRKWSKRNFIFLPILALLFCGNLFMHLEFLDIWNDGRTTGQRLGLGVVALLLAIIGGRVVPAFTTNALRNRGVRDLPVNNPVVNGLGIGFIAALLAADLAAPEHPATGWLALAAAAINFMRLAGWRGYLTLGQPILWVLHLGFAWLVAALALKGMAVLGWGLGEQTAIHALTAGSIGTMTLAVMSRAALGHTGRPLAVSPATVAAYLLVTAGALTRIFTPIAFPGFYNEGMLLSGIAWAGAFAIFAAVYWPVLTGPPLRGQKKAA